MSFYLLWKHTIWFSCESVWALSESFRFASPSSLRRFLARRSLFLRGCQLEKLTRKRNEAWLLGEILRLTPGSSVAASQPNPEAEQSGAKPRRPNRRGCMFLFASFQCFCTDLDKLNDILARIRWTSFSVERNAQRMRRAIPDSPRSQLHSALNHVRRSCGWKPFLNSCTQVKHNEIYKQLETERGRRRRGEEARSCRKEQVLYLPSA